MILRKFSYNFLSAHPHTYEDKEKESTTEKSNTEPLHTIDEEQESGIEDKEEEPTIENSNTEETQMVDYANSNSNAEELHTVEYPNFHNPINNYPGLEGYHYHTYHYYEGHHFYVRK